MSGTVTLVGAGPGDPGLLTLKGREALKQAQVVVYDRLVSPELLDLIPPEAKQIDVGKNAGHHPTPQWRINEILLEEAQKGLRVVRLKGGDPFLFGRGGEELELLAQNGIPFQVVPGVTSALSVPAYGGIPVTHRDFCSSLHIITGHFQAGSKSRIDFDALVKAGGTLVFLMGVSALPSICQGLLEAGMKPDTPAAIVENGTTPIQRKVLATVSTLAQRAEEEKIQSPAVSVFGQVCRLSGRFDWFDSLPLKGKTVVVTRPADRMGTLAEKLRALGAQVIEYPCIRTVPCRDEAPLKEAIARLEQYRWLVFTSPGGPAYFFRALLDSGRDVRALGHLKLAAIGPKTAQALAQWGLKTDLVPAVYDSDHLASALCQQGEGPVLLCRSGLGSPVVPQQLMEQGIAFSDVTCYDTIYEAPEGGTVLACLAQGQTLVTFTSASTVQGFVKSLPEGTSLSHVLGCCIGEKTRQEAERYGIATVTASSATIDSLVETILEKA